MFSSWIELYPQLQEISVDGEKIKSKLWKKSIHAKPQSFLGGMIKCKGITEDYVIFEKKSFNPMANIKMNK